MNPISSNFSVAALPAIEFGSGKALDVPALAASLAKRIILVTGKESIETTDLWSQWIDTFGKLSLQYSRLIIETEPSPILIDTIVNEHRDYKADLVIGIGGGSVLDAAKAIAGLLTVSRPVTDYLEGVGLELDYEGQPLPYIAVPTTAGTGSEMTKNAVLSLQGPAGYKKSFRPNRLVPDYAVVDPDLLKTCSPSLIAANGMDAFTQLMESYVSTKASPFTDALAMDGLTAVSESLLNWYENTGDVQQARTRMAYGSMLSGITLAQAGLGSVHGLASPLGAFYPMPHGEVCGTLVAVATQTNIEALQERQTENIALKKYANIGRLLAIQPGLDDTQARQTLLDILHDWTQRMKLPQLSQYGVDKNSLTKIVEISRGSSMKTNPIVLRDDEIENILLARL